MERIELDQETTDATFDEAEYLATHPDVAQAVADGLIPSGWAHFEKHGRREARRIRRTGAISDAKRWKLDQIAPLLRDDIGGIRRDMHWDFLSEELRSAFAIVPSEVASTWDYGEPERALIARHADGLVLDAGAGKKPAYYDTVVNLEIVPYDTTDVLAVGEVLPFRDKSFDAVISNAVLEHVKDPFRCAREIVRVLRPGGELYCVVPFLQPLHAYPHHYYNMSHEGLRNLFADQLDVESLSVPPTGLPIHSLAWILNSWASGLDEQTRAGFLDMQVRDLIVDPSVLVREPFVTNLPEAKNLELASAVLLTGRKPG